MSKPKSRFWFTPKRVAARKAKRAKQSSNASHSQLRLVGKGDFIKTDTVSEKDILNAYSAGRKFCAELQNASEDNEVRLSDALAASLKFYRLGYTNEKSRMAYESVIRDAGIRITKNTKNPLLPALKAIFGSTNKSSLGRYAAALHLADLEGVKPDRFAQFVKDEGGLVACAREGAARLNPRKAEEKAKRDRAGISALRKAGKPLHSPRLSKELSPGLSLAAIFKGTDGTLTLLGHRAEKEATVSRFKPLG